MPVRGFLKGHLKNEAGVKALIKRSVSNIKPKLDHYELVNDPPATIRPIVQPITEKMNAWKARVSGGDESVINQFLESLPDEKLAELKKIFEKKGRGQNTEDKILDSSFVVLSELDEINSFINELFRVKAEVINTYTEIYARTYNNSATSSGEVQFNNEPFLEALRDVISYRKRLRRNSQEDVSNDNLINDDATEDANRCVLM